MKTRLNGLLAFTAAAALAASPAMAAPAAGTSAARLSVAGAQSIRTATPAAKGSKAIPTNTLINIGVLAALVGVVLVATDGGDDDGSSPDSP